MGSPPPPGASSSLSCDMAVADEGARFATPGVKIGLFCSTPMVPLSRAVGRKRALQMLLTGQFVDSRTAAEWGLINDVVPADRLDEAVVALATVNRRCELLDAANRQGGVLPPGRS